MEQVLSLRQVADLLKLQHYRIEYALATHRIPEPALRVANKRLFQSADVERIRQHFNPTVPSVTEASPAT